jgi:hypothetical protein
MKNNLLFRAFATLLTIIILISCTKDSSLNDEKSTQQHENSNSALQKSILNGSLSGVLAPAPATAKVYAWHSNGTAAVTIADVNGTFRFDQLQEGIYTLLIEYISSGAGNNNDTVQYLKIRGIRISSNADTDLGTIAVD